MTGSGRIVTVGDVVTDVVAVLRAPLAAGTDTAAAIQLTGGGQAANTAAWLAWLGVPVTLVAAVGEDEAGRARLAELAALGVDCTVRRVPDAPTGTVIVLTGDGERTMVTDRGANLRLTAADVSAALAAAPDARHLHLSGYALLDAGSRGAALRALAAARDGGLTTSVDAASAAPLRQVGPAAFRSWVRGADLLLANADEAAVLADGAGAAARARELTGVTPHVVVKKGGGGAIWAIRDGEALSVPARPTPVVDVTGAGDAFAAGLLAAWVAGAGPAGALERATELGAQAVAQVGARPPAPGRPR
ncbi:PfkB family carbohydrate kinase [Micromonospora sp. NPDC049559]|uniref:carbohydrate kinase family protein n=1 Tax=Micromonospora sp. NPDC049559 TaxID=3155923 RepID=UPI0034316D5F